MSEPEAEAAAVGAVTEPAHEDGARVPDHVLLVPGGAWHVWRTGPLRGAGFPARMVLALAAEQTAAGADAYLAAEDEVARRRTEARAALARRMSPGDPESRRLRKLRRRLTRGRVPPDAAEDEACALRTAVSMRDSAYAALVEAFTADQARLQARLSAWAQDERFREALLWQDRVAAALVCRRVHGAGTPGQRRKAEDFLALHAQRYAVKNDSIGFFGPMMWATLVDAPATIEVRPGPALVDRREVYFEGWCIDRLAARLDRLPGIRPWLTPRLRTGAWRLGACVYLPGSVSVTLTPSERQLVELCDGRRTAGEIALAFGSDGDAGEHAFAMLERLVSSGVVTWRLEVASQLRPEQELAARLGQIGDPVLRAAALAPLRELTAARASVAAAAGNPDELERRLGDLDQTFTRLTGEPAFHNAGRTYGGRRLVYEDCRRDCEVRVGSGLLERIGPPLSIALDAARWAAGELAAAVRHQVRLWFREMRGRDGGPVDGHRFMAHLYGMGIEALDPIGAPVADRYQRAWQSLLGAEDGARTRCYDQAALAPRARELFGSPRPAWNRAAYLCPDIMVAAAGVEALRRGELHAVIGELHASNTLLSSAALSQHADPGTVLAALKLDTERETHVVPQTPKDSFLARLNISIPPTFWRYEFADELPSLPACRSIPVGMLIAVDDGRTVRLRARDGSLEFEALEVFGYPLVVKLNDILSQRLPPAPHVPRLIIGDLTISRETWNLRRAEMAFVAERDACLQFAAIRRWARDRGMPRHVFYKSPLERKPCYLDFDSIVYARIFARAMTHLPPEAVVRVTEMFPGIHQAWLPDSAGERYTCELRLAIRTAP